MTQGPSHNYSRAGRAILLAPLLTTALVTALGLVADVIVAFRSSPAYFGAVGHLTLLFGIAAFIAAVVTQVAVLPVLAVFHSRGMLRRETVIWSTSAVAILTVSALHRVIGIRLDVMSFVTAALFGALLGYFYGRLAWRGTRVQSEHVVGSIASER